ncbi:MAG: peptide ABC transporter substrate-binding protein, partial [Candidatus Lambdaproteobacteria bacterium]|nr:peptide ABC transporter substrate-binding protein [Candidatus Lambdaproteobacteria bacterium]
MTRRTVAPILSALLLAGALASPAAAQKYGGTLKALASDNPPNFSIHEASSFVTTFPMVPMFNNLVTYDPLQVRESFATIIPDLAESWQWVNGNRELVLKLRQGVTFHDGRPFTSRDAKHTFDIVRGKSLKRLRLNPRKLWYFNIEEIVTNGDHELVLKLKRPQPSILAMLATGFGA